VWVRRRGIEQVLNGRLLQEFRLLSRRLCCGPNDDGKRTPIFLPMGCPVPEPTRVLESAVTAPEPKRKMVFWHRELPPRDAEAIGDHTIEATSHRVRGTLSHRDDLWDRCYHELMDQARSRLEEEIGRLGGDCAHVLREEIEPRHDDRTGEAWMYGRFDYELYRRKPEPSAV
jgi:hypothetical protein